MTSDFLAPYDDDRPIWTAAAPLPLSAEREHGLARLAAAINAGQSLSEVLRLVRDGVLEAGGFDRVGVFLYDAAKSLLIGTWGTDRAGLPEDISSQQYAVTQEDITPAMRITRGELDYYLAADHAANLHLPPDDPMAGVGAHAVVPMRIGRRVAGILCVDNLLHNVPITLQNVEDLLPFANQAAVAIHKAQLQEEVRAVHAVLIQSEKMRAIGELAAGVTHNVNNVLALILNFAEMIQEAEGATAEIRRFARAIEIATLDGSDIVQRVQRFARQDSAAVRLPLDIGNVTQEAIDLTRPFWDHQPLSRGVKIDMVSRLTPNLQVQGVASEIREVLINLIKNAVEAMPTGGTLAIHCAANAGDAVLTIADTGTGMNEETRQRIFEPFYTTKAVERGTGLGLFVAWGIIDRHQGHIHVISAPGSGTTFEIRLPCENLPTPLPPESEETCSLNGARILLVEETERVIDCLGRILERHGATLTYAQTAQEALDWLRAHSSRCDLILSDQNMAGITGLQLLAQAQQAYPAIRRALLSGWSSDLPGSPDTSPAELILPKPLRQRRLIAALARLLNTGKTEEEKGNGGVEETERRGDAEKES